MTEAAFLGAGNWDQIQLLLAALRHSFSECLSSSNILCTKCMHDTEGNHKYIGSIGHRMEQAWI